MKNKMKKGFNKKVSEYARKIRFYKMPLVKKRVKMYDRLELEMEKAMVCPECGHKSLEFEGGSYEEGYGDGVYCNCCGFVSGITEKFEPLRLGNNFDALLWFAIDIKKRGLKEVEREVGCSWNEFCTKTIIEEDVT